MTLLDFGYAPGKYSSTCLTCGRQIQGVDKRCFCCIQCAKEKMIMSDNREWLPIASAPRDGTRVELWCERTEDIETQTVARFPSYGQYEVVEGDGIWLCNRGYPLCPTHWRPEPSGPESKPDQETKGER